MAENTMAKGALGLKRERRREPRLVVEPPCNGAEEQKGAKMRRYLILVLLFAVLFPNGVWAARHVNCSKQPNGTPCDDGNVCTANDVCQAGVCTGSPAAQWYSL